MKQIYLSMALLLTCLSGSAQWADAQTAPSANSASATDNVWQSQYPELLNRIKAPTFANRTYNIKKYGAKISASAEKNQQVINKVIRLCNKAGGGRVVIPAGTWNTGAIRLLSNVNLVIEKDARLLFAFDTKLYPLVRTRYEGNDCMNYSPLIYAYQEKNIAITGEGTIDGNGSPDTWWAISRRPAKTGHKMLGEWSEANTPIQERIEGDSGDLRTQSVNMVECENILISGITLIRSPFWVLHPLFCKNVTVKGVKVDNNAPNGDGCDPESGDGVLIEDCYFHTGDDCIAIKSGRNGDGIRANIPSQNIIVRQCQMNDGHGGVVIGSEISGGCKNVFVKDCVMDSPNLDRVIRIKTNPCRSGITDGVYVKDVKVGQCKEAVLKINLDYSPKEAAPRGHNPIVRNVFLENVTCEKSKYGVMIVALDKMTNVYNVNLKNCQMKGVTTDGNYITGLTRNINFENTTINGK